MARAYHAHLLDLLHLQAASSSYILLLSSFLLCALLLLSHTQGEWYP